MATLQIAVLLDKQGKPLLRQGFFLRETVSTVDGPRTRIVDGHYDTFDRAVGEVAVHNPKDPA